MSRARDLRAARPRDYESAFSLPPAEGGYLSGAGEWGREKGLPQIETFGNPGLLAGKFNGCRRDVFFRSECYVPFTVIFLYLIPM